MIRSQSTRTRTGRLCGASLSILLSIGCAVVGGVNDRHDADERQIRAMYDRLAAALRARDASAMMEHYAPNAQLFVVDLMSDGKNMSRDEYARHWQLWFAGLPLVTQATTPPGVNDLQIDELAVVTDGSLAFTHARLAGLLISDGLRKIDGKWLIAQEHVSRSLTSVAADRAKARTAADESSAVTSLRTLNTALVTYAAMFGQGFPATLHDLGAGGAQPASKSAGLIDPALASGTKNGYTFVYAPGTSDRGVVLTYTIQANPSIDAGQRFFFTDETAIIRANASHPAGKSDPPT